MERSLTGKRIVLPRTGWKQRRRAPSWLLSRMRRRLSTLGPMDSRRYLEIENALLSPGVRRKEVMRAAEQIVKTQQSFPEVVFRGPPRARQKKRQVPVFPRFAPPGSFHPRTGRDGRCWPESWPCSPPPSSSVGGSPLPLEISSNSPSFTEGACSLIEGSLFANSIPTF